MAGRWIYGVRDGACRNDLVNVDCLQSVKVYEQNWDLDDKQNRIVTKFGLFAIYRSSGENSLIDEFDNEEDATAAVNWFMLFLQGRIDIEEWDSGRKDREWRKQRS